MFLRPQEINEDSRVGGKARNLAFLKENNFPIPDFIVIPFSSFEQKNKGLENEIANIVPWELSAVRSSVEGEDSEKKSLAGQYKTEIKVRKNIIYQSALSVFLDAKSKNAKEGAVIIQRYIEPDVSGVCFTKGPNGEYGMHLSCVSGHGDLLVSGKKDSQDIIVFPGYRESLSDLGLPGESAGLMFRIEELFGCPQDIEWLVDSGVIWIVQSRPITTISKKQIRGFNKIDSMSLSSSSHFFSTGVDVGLPSHPVPILKSIFNLIYGPGGAVETTYKKTGVRVKEWENPLFWIEGHAFLDKQKEVKNIFPSYQYRPNKSRPESVTFKGLIRTLKNRKKIKNLVSSISSEEDHIFLKNILAPEVLVDTLEKWMSYFIDSYAEVFRINIRSQFWIEKLKMFLYTSNVSFQEAVTFGFFAPEFVIKRGLIGNSIDIEDSSSFVQVKFQKQTSAIVDLYKKSSTQEKVIIRQAAIYNRYREYARAATVVLINNLRNLLAIVAEKHVVGVEDLSFLSLNQLVSGSWDKRSLLKAKEVYKKQKMFSFPDKISNITTKIEETNSTVIYPGVLRGRVVSVDILEHNPDISGVVLAAKSLSPDLAKYMDRVVGVLSENGSFLSHFAILAREAKIPAVVIGKKVHSYIGKIVNVGTGYF